MDSLHFALAAVGIVVSALIVGFFLLKGGE